MLVLQMPCYTPGQSGDSELYGRRAFYLPYFTFFSSHIENSLVVFSFDDASAQCCLLLGHADDEGAEVVALS